MSVSQVSRFGVYAHFRQNVWETVSQVSHIAARPLVEGGQHMTLSRAQRRAYRAKAAATAATLASCCYDFDAGGLVRITRPEAKAALTRALARMLKADCRPLALPLSKAETEAFPRYHGRGLPDGVAWLAVGIDPDGRGTYAMQFATGPDRGLAHDAAREMALARVADLTTTRGFPTTKPKGRA